ncbi:uncharacterized protein LOC119066499 isoform X2 [Bradysia coprophila]|uniref:uncharacterized protein LOC119066499 isoform X2 n=1 Tax=Bradysia coprophila TaxID=38358 RepID=UPI00187DB50E|nr:uncharacterized protein LOC119066499 isoform X2 [Bradysia coprophila]
MDSECSQIVTEIIDELIETCTNCTQFRDNDNRTRGNEFKQYSDQCDDQSDAGESGHKEMSQEDETSYLAVEVEIFEQFDALEGNNCQTVDINDLNRDDKKLDRQDNAEPANDVKKSAGADCELSIGATDARCADTVVNDKKIDRQDNAEPANDVKKSAGADCELSIGATDARCADTVDDDKKLDRQENAEPANDVKKSPGADCELLIRDTDSRCADTVDDDKKLDRHRNAVSATDVKKTAGANCEVLESFSMENRRRTTMTNNLALMTVDNNVSKYEVRCEGFPMNMMEEELVLKFAKFGEVYKLTKHLDKELIYVTFIKAEDAEKAIEALDGRMIQGHRVKLYKQLPNRRLIVRCIPKTLNRDRLFAIFKSITPNLVSVSVYNDPFNENLIRNFCYLEYPDYYLAVDAKDILSSVQIFHTSRHSVEWPDRRFEWKETPDTLFISNIRLSMGSRDVYAVFSVFGKLVGVSKNGSFASVKFQKVDDAKRATIEVDKKLLGNENVEILSFKLHKENSGYEGDRNVSGNKTEKISSVHVMPRDEPNLNSNISDTLYINNLSATLSAADLRKIFSTFGNVLDIDIDRNEGLASVHFPNQEQAKRAVSSIDKRQLGNDVHISFFNNTVVGKASDVLHISNLRSNVMTSDLRKLFAVYGEVMEIELISNSAIVHFRYAKDARAAARSVNRQCMGDGVKISFGERTEMEIEKKPAVTAENKFEKKPAGTSANNIEKKPAATPKSKIDQKPTGTSANNIEKKRAESEYKTEKKRLATSNTLYIYNIYNDMTTWRLRQLFTAYGHVMDINVYADYASVQFACENDAIRAAHAINRNHLGSSPGLLEILFFPKNL